MPNFDRSVEPHVPLASLVATMGSLIHDHPALVPVLQEHLRGNNGEILAHPLLSDIVDHLVPMVATDPDLVGSVWAWLGEEYARGEAEVKNLIVESGVKKLPAPDAPGAEMRGMLDDRLREFDPQR